MIDVFVNGVKFVNGVDYTATNGTTVVMTIALAAGNIVEIDNYLTAFLPTNALRTITTFTATAAQTTFTVTYTQGLIDVFYNGSNLAQSEYTATNGTSIILATACQLNDIVVVYAYSYSVGAYSGIAGSGTINTIPKFTASSTIGDSAITDNGTTVTLVSRALAGTSATFTGNLTVDTNTLFVDSTNNNVGIGTISISQPSAGATTLRIVGTATTKGGAIYLDSSDSSVSTYIYADSASGLSINTSTSHPITLRTNGTTRLTIASTGAATFSSSVHLPSNSAGTAASLYFDYTANAASRSWRISNDYTAYGDFKIQQSTTQTGSTYADILAFSSTGAATFLSGISVGGATATTGGIQFPATAVAIADGNNLDDYEEGTSSPSATPAGGGAFTTVTQSGSYVKVGRMVNYSFIITINAVGSGSGDVLIALPFACGLSPIRPMGSGRENALTGNTLQIRTTSDGSTSALIIGGGTLANSWQALGTITYQTT
jgi:hypothetical protein